MRDWLQHNALLAALPVVEHARLTGALELVPLALGQVLHESGETMRHAWRLKAQVLKDEFRRGNALTHALLLFSSALITQMVQTAACNRHHTVDKQLCRWMLLSLDRLLALQTTGR